MLLLGTLSLSDLHAAFFHAAGAIWQIEKLPASLAAHAASLDKLLSSLLALVAAHSHKCWQ